jgi:hypothetical protein
MHTPPVFRSLLSNPLAPLALWIAILSAALILAGPLRLRKIKMRSAIPKEPTVQLPQPISDIDPLLARAFITMVSAPAAATPKPQPDVRLDREVAKAFITMISASAEATPKPRPATREEHPIAAASSPHPAPEARPQMTFLSVRADETQSDDDSLFVAIPCRLAGAISNGADGHRIVITGVVSDNIAASSGKILIEAGTKVVGSGWLDTLAGRIKSTGKWSLVTNNHVLKFNATLAEYEGALDGLRGVETSPEPASVQRQAVVRDGLYLYVPDKRPFVLQISGGFELSDLKAATED